MQTPFFEKDFISISHLREYKAHKLPFATTVGVTVITAFSSFTIYDDQHFCDRPEFIHSSIVSTNNWGLKLVIAGNASQLIKRNAFNFDFFDWSTTIQHALMVPTPDTFPHYTWKEEKNA